MLKATCDNEALFENKAELSHAWWLPWSVLHIHVTSVSGSQGIKELESIKTEQEDYLPSEQNNITDVAFFKS